MAKKTTKTAKKKVAKKKKKARKLPPITITQKRFCQILHSMKHPNHAEAYELAGFKAKGAVASAAATRLLKRVKVAAYMEQLGKRQEKRAERKAEEIVAELENIAFATIDEYLTFDKNGVQLKNSKTLTKRQLSAIQEVCHTETQAGGTKRLKLYDKRAALVDLGKRFGLFPNKQTIDAADGILQLNITVGKHGDSGVPSKT